VQAADLSKLLFPLSLGSSASASPDARSPVTGELPLRRCVPPLLVLGRSSSSPRLLSIMPFVPVSPRSLVLSPFAIHPWFALVLRSLYSFFS